MLLNRTAPKPRARREDGGPCGPARIPPARFAAVPVALVVVLVLALAGCLPAWRADDGGMARLLENRVWIDTGADAAPGALLAFLSDGTLLMTSCVETYRLASWRWARGPVLMWQEDGRTLLAEIVLVGPDELALVTEVADGSLSRRYRAAEVPVVCPDLPR
jgi:hypothetical protein